MISCDQFVLQIRGEFAEGFVQGVPFSWKVYKAARDRDAIETTSDGRTSPNQILPYQIAKSISRVVYAKEC
jgi:hypothetical protein